MEQFIKATVQGLFSKAGYQIRKKEAAVDYEDAFSEQARLLANQNVKVIFDIGAANGRTSEQYHQAFPNATIYSFEPFPDSFKALQSFAQDKPYIVPLNFAVSDQVATADFHVTALNDASSLFSPNMTGSSFDRHHVHKNTIQVKTTTIDAICAQYQIGQIDLLKLDTQGAELIALKGASKILGEKRIKLIYSEVQFIHLYKGAAQFFEINHFLDSVSLRLFNIYNLSHNQKGQLAWGDAIFIHKEGEL
jgi:FkbM family methyltransferase